MILTQWFYRFTSINSEISDIFQNRANKLTNKGSFGRVNYVQFFPHQGSNRTVSGNYNSKKKKTKVIILGQGKAIRSSMFHVKNGQFLIKYNLKIYLYYKILYILYGF